MARILIVDDEQAIVTLMRFILEKAGHEVVEAYNGVEGLAILGVEPEDAAAELPDLILLDVMMPIMDGHTMSLRVSKHGRASKIPIIVVTAKGDTRALFENMPGVAAFFGKPFNPKDLREAVVKALAGRCPPA
jgi:CheY-like chemotaxis protein